MASFQLGPVPSTQTPQVSVREHCPSPTPRVIFICVVLEIVGYCILLAYYDAQCQTHYGAATCAYAIDKEWQAAIINTPGLRWIECCK